MMEKRSLWSPDERNVLSTHFMNVMLSKVTPLYQSSARLAVMKEDAQENLEMLIVNGLEDMHPKDFHCSYNLSRDLVKDSIAFCWALRVKELVAAQAFLLQFHSRAYTGSKIVDFFFSGTSTTNNGIIELMFNAVHSKGQVQSMPDHLVRFSGEKDRVKNWAILNFAMTSAAQTQAEKSMSPGLLPSTYTTKQLSRVYTYVHEENALYQGNDLIKKPAVCVLTSDETPTHVHHAYVPLRERETKKIGMQQTKQRSFSTASAGSHVLHIIWVVARRLFA